MSKIKGYKAFDKDLKCRDFQYKVGENYKEKGDICCCDNGFHFCENPFDVLNYYPLIDDDGEFSRFAKVEGSGKVDRGKDKVCVSNIKVIEELTLGDFVNNGVEFIQNQTKDSANYESVLSDNSGDYAKIGSSGDSAKIGSSGDSAQIGSSGDSAKIGSSGDSAKIGSSGDYAKIGSSGNYAQIGSSGDYAKINSSGNYSVVMCAGNESKVRAKKGSWITLAEWEYDKEKDAYIPICVKTEQVDGERIKEDTYYTLKNGEFKEI